MRKIFIIARVVIIVVIRAAEDATEAFLEKNFSPYAEVVRFFGEPVAVAEELFHVRAG